MAERRWGDVHWDPLSVWLNIAPMCVRVVLIEASEMTQFENLFAALLSVISLSLCLSVPFFLSLLSVCHDHQCACRKNNPLYQPPLFPTAAFLSLHQKFIFLSVNIWRFFFCPLVHCSLSLLLVEVVITVQAKHNIQPETPLLLFQKAAESYLWGDKHYFEKLDFVE